MRFFRTDGFITEEFGFHDKRNQRFRNYLLGRDAYGFEKLTCENLLLKHWGETRKYLILRLPDVIGPYDDSGRFWKIVIQMMLFKK